MYVTVENSSLIDLQLFVSDRHFNHLSLGSTNADEVIKSKKVKSIKSTNYPAFCNL